MFTATPQIVWPAPGLPAFVDPDERSIELVVAGNDDPAALLRWCASLRLQRVATNESIGLTPQSAVVCPDDLSPDALHGPTDLWRPPGVTLTVVRVKPQRPLAIPPGRRVALFDLVRHGQTMRSRSVAATRLGDRLELAFVSDLHCAAMWDPIADAVDRHANGSPVAFLHPERQLDRFIEAANRRVAEGRLDLIVLGGDLVDHVYPHFPGNGARGTDSNVRRLVDRLRPLEAPTIAIAGNHDYRLYPWRPRLYGLQPVGLDRRMARQVLRPAGLWDRLPLTHRDLRSLRTRHGDVDELDEHRRQLAPATDFALTLAGMRLIFVSTGCDAVARWRDVRRDRWPMLLRSLSTAWDAPNSFGLAERQVTRTGQWLTDAAGAAVFLHAPILHSSNGHADGVTLELAEQDRHRDRLAFERRAEAQQLRHGAVFRNPGMLLATLLAANVPVTTFSGHVHRNTAKAVQRASGRLVDVPFNGAARHGNELTLLTTAALGQYGHTPDDATGYLTARFERGVLSQLVGHVS